MTPLAPLQVAASRELLPNLLAKAGEGLAPQAVPPGELEKLGSMPGTAPAQGSGPASGSFSNVLGQMVQDVNAKQSAAGDAVNGLLTGQNVSLHQAMISMEEANVSFQLMVEV